MTFDLGGYDITTGYYVMTSSQFTGHTWGEAQALLTLMRLRFLRVKFPLLPNWVHTGHNLCHVFYAV